MTHVRTAAYYPQSNGKIERFHKTIKGDAIRVRTLVSYDDARKVITDFVAYYNGVRLHSAIGYITPNDMLAGKKAAIHAERDRRLEGARELRTVKRQQARKEPASPKAHPSQPQTASVLL